MTDLREYTRFTRTTAVYMESIEKDTDVKSLQEKLCIAYCALELADEAGEAIGKIKKHIRGDYGFGELQERVSPELGDILYPLARLCDELGIDIQRVLEENIEKLQGRKDRGKIKGDGDYR